MSKAPANFRQTDMTRALRAVRTAGFVPIAIDYDSKTGNFLIKLRNDPEHECDGDKVEAAAADTSG